MAQLLPMFALVALCLIGVGVYRPYKYGEGSRRHLGLIPLALALVGWIVVPLVSGVLRGMSGESAGASSAEVAAIAVPVLLAMCGAAMNVWKFRPPRAS
jgi:hypothetical protein